MTSHPDTKSHSGGCQCGAVRYRIRGAVGSAHLCHCRMCQKAAGSYFMALGGTTLDHFEITRGTPSWFKSSAPVSRGFCAACGTPLFFSTDGGNRISVTLGSLDDPASVTPLRNDGVEAMVRFFTALAGLPGTLSGRDDLPGGLAAIASSNRQHPDHDTPHWDPDHGNAGHEAGGDDNA